MKLFVKASVLFLALCCVLLPIQTVTADAPREVIGSFSGQCTAYVQQYVPEFTGVTTLEQKKNYINTSLPTVGCIAIMSSGGSFAEYGHVGFVEKVDWGQITISEANYISVSITQSTGTRDELHIIGYYRPDSARAVIFYGDNDAKGWCRSFYVPESANIRYNWPPFPNDQLSSVMICSNGITVELYEHDQLQGRRLELQFMGLVNLDYYSFNDICSSFFIK